MAKSICTTISITARCRLYRENGMEIVFLPHTDMAFTHIRIKRHTKKSSRWKFVMEMKNWKWEEESSQARKRSSSLMCSPCLLLFLSLFSAFIIIFWSIRKLRAKEWRKMGIHILCCTFVVCRLMSGITAWSFMRCWVFKIKPNIDWFKWNTKRVFGFDGGSEFVKFSVRIIVKKLIFINSCHSEHKKKKNQIQPSWKLRLKLRINLNCSYL